MAPGQQFGNVQYRHIYILQINGVDVSDATHDQAVALLTSGEKTITLVVYREDLVVNHIPSPVPSPKFQINQPAPTTDASQPIKLQQAPVEPIRLQQAPVEPIRLEQAPVLHQIAPKIKTEEINKVVKDGPVPLPRILKTGSVDSTARIEKSPTKVAPVPKPGPKPTPSKRTTSLDTSSKTVTTTTTSVATISVSSVGGHVSPPSDSTVQSRHSLSTIQSTNITTTANSVSPRMSARNAFFASAIQTPEPMAASQRADSSAFTRNTLPTQLPSQEPANVTFKSAATANIPGARNPATIASGNSARISPKREGQGDIPSSNGTNTKLGLSRDHKGGGNMSGGGGGEAYSVEVLKSTS